MIAEQIEYLLSAPLSDAIAAACGGPPLLIRCRTERTLDRLRQVAETDHFQEVLIVETGQTPTSALLQAVATAGFSLSTLNELVVEPDLAGKLLLADGRDLAAQEWRNIAGLFASRRARSAGVGPTLVVRVDSNPCPAGCTYIDDSAMTGPAESMLLAQRSIRKLGLVSEAADHAAIETARGDLYVLEQLLRLPDQERLHTSSWCRKQPCLESKPLLWRGKEEKCPIWLAHHDLPRLEHRIWRGQMMSIFPWLEEAREEFLALHGKRIPVGAIGEQGERLDVNDYEWGHISFALKNMGLRDTAHWAHALRKARNQIAHGEPLTHADASLIEPAFMHLIRAKI